ncbi:hypothetical protein [Halobellus ruber]|uniref:Uncharacterized protein n=1 Tax=Halobellus ruber TaxID=2761102 RepID=A0A7J9SM27_9EURY|nr:hypothetical protein [Halobellus ruber]MBB6647975.1 hypothetical protein [Halobellus ruber]
MSSERATLTGSVPDARTEQKRRRGDGVDEVGAIVVDADDDSTDRDEAIVVNTPPVPIDEWTVRRPGQVATVAEDNPAYDPGDAVIVVAFRDELEAAHPEWEPPEAIELPAACRTFAFPQRRLRRVGAYGEDGAEGDAAGAEGSTGLELSEPQRRLRTRLEESCRVDVDVREGEAVLVAEKLGDEHVIHPDGSVEGGAIAGRLEDVAAEYLGGGE